MLQKKYFAKKTGTKYGSKATTLNGIRFDSKKEAKRYNDLLTLTHAGEVDYFLRQVPFHLPGNVTYRVDFAVFWSDGRITYEDVKGFKTKTFIMKKKQVEALYPVEILVL